MIEHLLSFHRKDIGFYLIYAKIFYQFIFGFQYFKNQRIKST